MACTADATVILSDFTDSRKLLLYFDFRTDGRILVKARDIVNREQNPAAGQADFRKLFALERLAADRGNQGNDPSENCERSKHGSVPPIRVMQFTRS